jgi:PPOX class probable FMN-dependent enzyme
MEGQHMYQATDVISTEAQLRAVIPDQFTSQTAKVIDRIDDFVRVWIERSPFLTMATVGPDGTVDVSPKGDPAGFVKVLDDHTLAIPDRPGNHRYDSFLNIMATGRIGLMFMVPNRREVVRVNGSAQVVRDADLRARMAIQSRVPDFAVLVRVEEAFYHCGKSVIRSGLWEPDNALPVDGLPTYGAALKAHGRLEDPIEDLERQMRRNEDLRLYDE